MPPNRWGSSGVICTKSARRWESTCAHCGRAKMADTLEIVNRLYCDFFERGVRYFFSDARLTADGPAPDTAPSLSFHSRTDGSLDLEWMGTCYHLQRAGRPFTEDQLRLLGAIGAVLSARYRSIFFPASAASTSHLF